uniref:Uncharacterized protein AlNc14C1G201 n=1 Tax=Albugo laibachii Nc14 TaxID=890382 RepID=F0VZ60_9STRA|nr:conserved hypothetical protein [Albugo laibachii Nc14]|eukprot:CCA14075.1 conserved hypothetical protein [Albugo laibachii Nc14]
MPSRNAARDGGLMDTRKQDAENLLKNLNTTVFLRQYKRDKSALTPEAENKITYTYDSALRKLDEIANIYLKRQIKQTLMEKLGQLDDDDALHNTNAVSSAETSDKLLRSRQYYEQTITEREAIFQRVQQVAKNIAKGKKELDQMMNEAEERYESKASKLTEQWTELQRRNAQRKAAIQMSAKRMINNEDDCKAVLETQTKNIQEFRQQKQSLQDSKLDLVAQLKTMTAQFDSLSKKRSDRESTVDTKKREEQTITLRRMHTWYTELSKTLEKISGIKILESECNEDHITVLVLEAHRVQLHYDLHSNKLSDIQISPSVCDTAAIIEYAVQENDVKYLLLSLRHLVQSSAPSLATADAEKVDDSV